MCPINYGIDAYLDWNSKPIGGGCGYTIDQIPVFLQDPPNKYIVLNLNDLLINLGVRHFGQKEKLTTSC